MSNKERNSDLSQAKAIDFARTALGYEKFRELARNPHLSREEKIAFPEGYRRGFETQIIEDVETKLPALTKPGSTVIDIGCGCGTLSQMLIAQCGVRDQQLVLVDSEEMLTQLEDWPWTAKVPGSFPDNTDTVQGASPEGADAVICYSVLHYAFIDTNLFRFVDSLMSLLAPGGGALIGDIPNISKRKRFFFSETGKAFHRKFMNKTEDPVVEHLQIEPDQIDDSVLFGLMQRAQAAGFDAYLLPQAPELPFSNRRDDLLIRRP